MSNTFSDLSSHIYLPLSAQVIVLRLHFAAYCSVQDRIAHSGPVSKANPETGGDPEAECRRDRNASGTDTTLRHDKR